MGALLGLFVVGLAFMDGLALSTIVAVALALAAARDAAVIVVYPATAPQSAQTASLVHRLRD